MSIRSLISTAGALAIVAGAPMTLAAQNASADFKADNAFVSQVAASNLLEVRLGQTAESKATTPRVKQYAAKMVNDHTSAQQQWMAVSRKYDASFNARLSSDQEQQLERLRNLSGREFEVAYMDQMVQNHQANLNTFTTTGRSARSADTRELVERGILMIGEHSRLATQIRGELDQAVAANQPDTQAAAGAPSPWPNVKKDQPQAQPQPSANQQNQANAANAGAKGTGDINKDAEFVRDAAAHHYLEQQLGLLAVRKARNPQVKEYAKQTANDHANMEEAWIRMARNNGLTINPGMGPNHREKLTELEKASASSFDKKYMQRELDNHEWYINELIRDGQKANSSDVRELVTRFFETETNHLNLAKRVGAQVGADTTVKLKGTFVK